VHGGILNHAESLAHLLAHVEANGLLFFLGEGEVVELFLGVLHLLGALHRPADAAKLGVRR